MGVCGKPLWLTDAQPRVVGELMTIDPALNNRKWSIWLHASPLPPSEMHSIRPLRRDDGTEPQKSTTGANLTMLPCIGLPSFFCFNLLIPEPHKPWDGKYILFEPVKFVVILLYSITNIWFLTDSRYYMTHSSGRKNEPVSSYWAANGKPGRKQTGPYSIRQCCMVPVICPSTASSPALFFDYQQ